MKINKRTTTSKLGHNCQNMISESCTFWDAMFPYFDAFSFAVLAIFDAPNDNILQPVASDETVVSKNSCDWLFGIGSLE